MKTTKNIISYPKPIFRSSKYFCCIGIRLWPYTVNCKQLAHVAQNHHVCKIHHVDYKNTTWIEDYKYITWKWKIFLCILSRDIRYQFASACDHMQINDSVVLQRLYVMQALILCFWKINHNFSYAVTPGWYAYWFVSRYTKVWIGNNG